MSILDKIIATIDKKTTYRTFPLSFVLQNGMWFPEYQYYFASDRYLRSFFIRNIEKVVTCKGSKFSN